MKIDPKEILKKLGLEKLDLARLDVKKARAAAQALVKKARAAAQAIARDRRKLIAAIIIGAIAVLIFAKVAGNVQKAVFKKKAAQKGVGVSF